MDTGSALPALIVDITPASKPGADQLDLSSLKGKPVVIYFYPKDDTPGCTTEGKDFAEHYDEFRKKDVTILGVSRDSLRKHAAFRAKYDFPFELVSDPDETLCQAFSVMKMKNMYGKEHMGVERSTFLFGSDGTLARHWRGVKVPGHVEEVLAAVQAL